MAWLSQTGQSALCIFSASPKPWGRTLPSWIQLIVSHNTSWQHHSPFPTFHCSFWAISSCGSSSTATCGASEAGWALSQVRMSHSCARLCRAGLCQPLALQLPFVAPFNQCGSLHSMDTSAAAFRMHPRSNLITEEGFELH